MASYTKEERQARKYYAKNRSIIEVAEGLGMELVRSGRDFRWKEHDSMVLSPEKNLWNWFSQHKGGDTIALVQEIRQVSFNQAVEFINDGNYQEAATEVQTKETFSNYLEPYEKPFEEGRAYLKDVRGLSDETIDFFYDQGAMTQADAKIGNVIVPVIVFKTLDHTGKMVGGNLQGIVENRELYQKHGYFKGIMRNSNGFNGFSVDIGKPERLIFAESPIDLMSYYELHKDQLENVRLVSMDGLKEAIIGTNLVRLESELQGRRIADQWLSDDSHPLDDAVKNGYFSDGKHGDIITLVVDNDEGGHEFINSLQDKGVGLVADLPPEKPGEIKQDWNDVLKASKFDNQKIQEEEKILPATETDQGLHNQIEDTKKAPEHIQEQIKKERTSWYMGSLQPEAEGSPSPEVTEATSFERSVTRRPTVSSRYINISIKDGFKSRETAKQHSITETGLSKINRYGREIQDAAIFYRDELAHSTVSYFTSNGDIAQVTFKEGNFMHLTGIEPIGKNGRGIKPTKFLHDFANGGDLVYDDILIDNNEAAFSKMKVLPDLAVVFETNAFYFDNLQDIERYRKNSMDSLIKSDDRDIMLLFRSTHGEIVPVSVFKARTKLVNELDSANKNEIIGIFRERDGKIEKMAINSEFVKDDGQEMLETLRSLKSMSEGEITLKNEDNPSPEQVTAFTNVLDAVYNVGRSPLDRVPENTRSAWEHFYQMAAELDNDFDDIVERASQDGLLDKQSDFYKEYQSDINYNENYQVRVNWAENHELGPTLSFSDESQYGLNIDYKTFVKEVYKANQEYFQKHLDSINDPDNYIPVTKVSFDLYGPGGQLLQERVRYNIAEETNTISQIVHNAIPVEDENQLYRLDLKAIYGLGLLMPQNLANEVETTPKEPLLDTPIEYSSPKTEVKQGIAERVEQLLAQSRLKASTPAQEESAEETPSLPSEPAIKDNLEGNLEHKRGESTDNFPYQTASAEELIQQAIKAIRNYTNNPDELKEYLDFMSNFPKYSPLNTALINEQWRGANAVATYNQWRQLGERLGIDKDDVKPFNIVYHNNRTGEKNEVKHEGLSVAAGQKGQIRLFRPMMTKMIPVLDENGQQVKNDKGNPKFKPYSTATADEKQAVKLGQLDIREFQVRDPKTGNPRYLPFTVFELSQTNIRPESLPKLMPNRHYNFDTDQVKTHEVLQGLRDYAEKIGVRVEKSDTLGNAKGSFSPDQQVIKLNEGNTQGEMIGTFIHELAHASLHNPKFEGFYKKDVPTEVKELEAEMTSYITSKHFGLDTSEKAIPYMAGWTKKLSKLSDKELEDSMKRVHQTSKNMISAVEVHTRPLERKLSKSMDLDPNMGFSASIKP